MKTNTKLLAGAIALFGIAILISSFKKPEETTKKYLTMAVSRTGMAGTSQITIMPETGLPDMIELESGYSKDVLITNAVMINTNINAIADKGYRLISTVCDNFPQAGEKYGGAFTVYIFEKN